MTARKFLYLSLFTILNYPVCLSAQVLTIDEHERLYSHGCQVLAFHNEYYEGRRGAVEIVLHGDRIASNGDIRLEPIPIPDGHALFMPEYVSRKVNRLKNEIIVEMNNPALGFGYNISIIGEGDNIRITVNTDGEISDSLIGKLAFMLEIFPGIYRGKSYIIDETKGIFPNQFNGTREFVDKEIEGVPIAKGKRISVAPDDPLHHFTIEAVTGHLELLDGRASTNHKWYIVRTLLSSDHQSPAAEWIISPKIDPHWMSVSVVSFSQIGYHSVQSKVSVIEMDNIDTPDSIYLYKINSDGQSKEIKSEIPQSWGNYYSKKYARFDFSEITEEGVYYLEYRKKATEAFLISKSLFDNEFWRPTMETFIPVQMCHMAVWDRMRLWHDACHLDDARQAPAGMTHFDHYDVLPEILTGYKPYEHIPYLNVGGFHDAGDSDIESPSNTSVVYNLSLAYEEFGLQSDQTFVDYNDRMVRLHEPDGKPDLLQQIVHGVEHILGNYRAFGQYSRGIICPDFEQYLQMGDPSGQTDGLVYNSDLGKGESNGQESGRNDDRLIFTNKNTSYEYGAARALAIASRALKNYDPGLSEECLETALMVWENENQNATEEMSHPYYGRYRRTIKKQTAIELFLSTGNDEFREILTDSIRVSRRMGAYSIWSLCRVVDQLNDPGVEAMLKEAVKQYKVRFEEELAKSPYHVPPIHSMFGTGFRFMDVARMHYFLHKKYPDIIDMGFIYDVVSYMHGNHPVCNHSLVNGVGAKSITSSYGFNRADFSYVPGGICAGPLVIHPDLIEFQVNDPFFWVQKEYTISSATSYLFLMLAAAELAK